MDVARGQISGTGLHNGHKQALTQLSNWSSAANQTTTQGPNGNCYRVKPAPRENLTREDLGTVRRLWWKELVEPVMNELRVLLPPLPHPLLIDNPKTIESRVLSGITWHKRGQRGIIAPVEHTIKLSKGHQT